MTKCALLVVVVFLAGVTSSNWAHAENVCLPFNLKYAGKGARSIWIGSTIPKAMRKQIQELQKEIIKSGAKGEPEHLERLHVTLKYLGSINQNPESVDYIAATLRSKVPIITLTMKIKKIGILNHSRSQNPRLVWAELDSLPLHRTFERIENALDNFCIRETRTYKPHITLFTFGEGQEKKPLPKIIADRINNIAINIPEFEVKGFRLMQSAAAPRANIALAKFKRTRAEDPLMKELEASSTSTLVPMPKRCEDLFNEVRSADSALHRALDSMKRGETTSIALRELKELVVGKAKLDVERIERKWTKVRKKMADIGSRIITKRKTIEKLKAKLTNEYLCYRIHLSLFDDTASFIIISHGGMEKVMKLLDELKFD